MLTERWFDRRVVVHVLVSAAVLLLLYGLGAHAPFGAAGALPAEAALELAPVAPLADAPAPDQDGCPRPGEQSGEPGWAKPPPYRDGGRRAHRRDVAGEADVAARTAKARRAWHTPAAAGRPTGPRLPIIRC